jgi:hypothetical protein
MRVYLPATRRDLSDLRDTGGLVSVSVGYAVTPSLRAWVTTDGPADDEELELAAFSEAARHSVRLLAGLSAATEAMAEFTRVVLSVDVPTDAVRIDDEGPEDDPGRVRVQVAAVPVGWVASVHADQPSATPAVRAAALALAAADAGDQQARLVVEAVDDHELLWYSPDEITVLR